MPTKSYPFRDSALILICTQRVYICHVVFIVVMHWVASFNAGVEHPSTLRILILVVRFHRQSVVSSCCTNRIATMFLFLCMGVWGAVSLHAAHEGSVGWWTAGSSTLDVLQYILKGCCAGCCLHSLLLLLLCVVYVLAFFECVLWGCSTNTNTCTRPYTALGIIIIQQ